MVDGVATGGLGDLVAVDDGCVVGGKLAVRPGGHGAVDSRVLLVGYK